RNDPLLAVVCEKDDPEGEGRKLERDRGKALAGKSTLQRLETAGEGVDDANRYKKIVFSGKAIEEFLVNVFLKTSKKPKEIVLDVDTTDDPVHGNQEGRFFHGYYDCYCYLPLYIFCGGHLLCAKLRTADSHPAEGAVQELEGIIGKIRERWPELRVIVRGDSGFCTEEMMSWCEGNEVDYVFGIKKNSRLVRRIEKQLKKVKRKYLTSGKSQRLYRDFRYRTVSSWSRKRRVVGKAEYLALGENPRFIVTSISREEIEGKKLYEEVYCARGDMENRIKEQQLYLFSDRTSSATMRANQLRLWFSSVGYVLFHLLRTVALRGTELAKSQCENIRVKLLKIGAQVKVSVRRVYVSLASGYPSQETFWKILKNIKGAYPQLC
nr:IS1380 family transposase [Desulfobacterales bacterium]